MGVKYGVIKYHGLVNCSFRTEKFSEFDFCFFQFLCIELRLIVILLEIRFVRIIDRTPPKESCCILANTNLVISDEK